MINNTTVENKHTTTGILATVYPITFDGATDANGYPLLKVTITDTEGAVMNLVYNIDYALVYDDNQEGNDESLNEPHLNGIKFLREELAVAGNSLSIIRNTPFIQPIDFQVGRIDPEQAENAADKSVLRDQELRNQMVKDEDVIDDHEERITTAEGDIDTIEATLSEHLINFNNPHQTSIDNLTDTNINALVAGQFMMFDGLKWKNVYSSATASWGTIIGNITAQTDLMNKFTEYVRTDGTSVMTAPLKMRATSSFQCAIAPFWDGVGFYKLNSDDSVTLIASIETPDGFVPWVTNTYNIGSSLKKWKNLYLAGKAYMSVINNGYDIAVPVTNSADTLALKSEVDLAANSGDQLTEKGVWYAKMYSATVAPSAEDGTNYADFSQTDGQGNPIIVIYKRQNGAWVQDQTITPPAEYNGYVTVTSKIWDIVEQSGQQGGKVLWSHNTKTFTPYPQIISFENATLTGTPTAPTLNASSPSNQIVNKQTLENALANNGTGRNVGDVFFTMRNDNELNGAVECNGATYNTTDFTGAQSIGQLLANGKVPYVSLSQYATLLSTQGSVGVFGWDGGSTTEFRVPILNDIFVEAGTAAQIGDYLPAGLPNITGNFKIDSYANPSATGAFTQSGNYSAPNHGNWADEGWKINLNASRSSSVYKDDVDTVQPNTVRYRAMVQLATSASDEAVETCTSVLAMLANADFVIERQDPTIANNYTWYKKYKSGRVEQGGIKPANTTTVDFPVTMANNDYWYIVKGNYDNPSGSYSSSHDYVLTRLTTGFILSTGGTTACWEVKGMAAS